MVDEIPIQLARLGRLCFVLLDGHPTAEQLASGIGKRGHPVSIHNEYCDWLCNEVKTAYWAVAAWPAKASRYVPMPGERS